MKTKNNKEVNGQTVENNRETQKNKNTQIVRPMSAKVDMGLTVCFLLVSQWFLIVVALAPLVVLVSLVFPMVFDVLKLLHCMFKRVPGNN